MPNVPHVKPVRLRRKSAACCAGCGSCGPCATKSALAVLDGREAQSPAGFSYKVAPGVLALDAATQEEPEFDDGAMAITYPFAASQGRDRVGDFLEVEGIDTAHHERNSVAYVEHGLKYWHLPIGYDRVRVDGVCSGAYTVKILADRGLAVCQTFLSQHLREAEQVYHLYREGILRGGSIGYRPLEATKLAPDPEQGHRVDPKKGHAGLHLKRVELLETTLTGLPMNGDAVRRSIEMGCCGAPLAPGLKAMLSERADPAPVWSRGWAPPGKTTDANGVEHDSSNGQFTGHGEAAGEMLRAHPHPGRGPDAVPGTGRPDLVAKDPKLQAAVKEQAEHADKFNRHVTADTVHRMVAEKPAKPVPLPPPEAGEKKRKGLALRAIEAVSAAELDVHQLEHPAWASHRQAVTGSHARGGEVLEEAKKEARRRLDAAVGTAKAHIAGLPEGQREKAAARLARVEGGWSAGDDGKKSLGPAMSWTDATTGGALVGGGFRPCPRVKPVRRKRPGAKP